MLPQTVSNLENVKLGEHIGAVKQHSQVQHKFCNAYLLAYECIERMTSHLNMCADPGTAAVVRPSADSMY